MLLPVQFVTSNIQGKLYRRSGKGTMVTGMKSGMGLLDLAVTSMILMVLEWTSARSKNSMAGFSLVVVASVKPPSIPEEIPACQARLDRLEGDLQHRLRCMSENGGMNIRDETIRRRRRN